MQSTFRADLVPMWAKIAAWTVPLCCVPSVAWRLVHTMGTLADDQDTCDSAGGSLLEKIYVVALLPAGQLGLALLTLGLIRPWGEVLPPWLPVLGGRRVPVALAVATAAAGAVIILVGYWYSVVEDLWGPLLLSEPVTAMNSVPAGCPNALGWDVLRWYIPIALWPPLLLAVTWHYLRRRTRVGGS
jgi:hypothetical protein